MAEDESDQESERLVEELEAIADEELGELGAGQLGSREYCRRFCEVVEDYTARWQVPLPQLQVLQTALCCFTSASVSFPTECEHVQCVLGRLALSLFELLLFFGKDEFYEAPLKDILGSVQECHDLLIRYDDTDLRLVTCVIKDGGPWEDPVLQAILKGKSEPQEIVDKYLRSENQLFFEFRVRYLIACERISEAVALITTCLSHPEVSKNLYYHQAYFICLHMTRLTDKLLPEHVLRIDCSDGVQIICNIEKEGKTALALQLSEAFLITQLQTGKMYCIWDLIFIWSKLQLKVNPSKQAFIEQCYNMLRIAANVKVIFPFMKTIKEEIGECAVQLSVELCGCALQLDLQDDPETKSLIYKTIAYLLPYDLEICRICALSVFFLERNVESYRVVERLYRYSDEDYNEFTSYVANRVRFELLPILKRGLLFDPEFWNFSMIQTNCADLLGGEGALVLSNADTSELVLSNADTDALVLSNADTSELVLSNSDTSELVLSNSDTGELVLSNSDTVALENVVEQQSLPLEDAVTPLHNGELKHKESSSRLRASSTPRKTHTVLTPPKVDTATPRHHCTLCKRQFLGGHILRHAQTHHKRGWFSCVICARKFRNKVKMLRHLKHHLKKMQRHPAGHSLKASSDPVHMYSDRNEENSSEGSPSSPEAENSNQDLLDHNRTIPGKNHTVDRNGENVNYSTATQTSFSSDVSNPNDTSALGETQQLEDDAGKNLSQGVKLNGSLLCSEDPVVNHQVSYPCPAQGCHRVFTKARALNKHARNAHPSDLKVQQHILSWNKGKCRFCQRKFDNCRHFIDHLKMHFYPNVYFCQQLNCNKRFKLATQLVEHQHSHENCKLQCGFMNCPEVFDQISSLHEHEAQHYEQNAVDDSSTSLPNMEPVEADHVPQEDNANLGQQQAMPLLSSKKVQPSHEEALDLPIPIWKSRKDVAEPKTYKQADKKVNGEVHLPEQVLQADSDVQDPLPEGTQAPAAEEQNLNGHTAEEPSVVVETGTVDNETETVIPNPPCSDTAEETLPTNIATENEQTPSKPNASTSAFSSTQARPYRRPLPPTYLAEQYLSMPKRRKNDLTYTSENHTVSKAPVGTFRCGKCLTNYCSSEALEEHLAQKKCQLYFGFDSDDESAW